MRLTFYRGLDNRVYYMLAPEGQYYNYSGCGNTFNCNHPQARKFIVDCLRYWVLEMHVDGFRFDLASILTRAPSIWHQNSDETTASAFAEAGSIPPPPKRQSKRSFAEVSSMADSDTESETEEEPLDERIEGRQLTIFVEILSNNFKQMANVSMNGT